MRANLLLMHYARRPLDCAVCEADRLTSMADARTGSCIAAGVALDDIDPSSGYDHSRRAYNRVRASWIDLIRQHGASQFHEIPGLEEVRASWAKTRPEFVDGDDWLPEAVAAHHQFVESLAAPCRRTT
ncbi:hypothetical protein ACIBUR_39425 [Streptomyces anulatus]